MPAAHERAPVIRSGVLRLARRLRAERPGDALAPNKVSVLAYLQRRGPSAPGAIAAAEHQQPQSLTRTFNELQLAGLITRRPSQQDRRESVLTITTAGGRALRRDMADRDAWLSDALGTITEAEADILVIAAALMDRLAERTTVTRSDPRRARSA